MHSRSGWTPGLTRASDFRKFSGPVSGQRAAATRTLRSPVPMAPQPKEISMSAVLAPVTQTLPLFAGKVAVSQARLENWPLPPELVLSGQPSASGLVLFKSEDGRSMSGIWACTPGSFRWRWTDDETVVVVSGRATVSMGDGRRIELSPGDLAFFESGQDSVWTIHEPFRKGFHTL